MLDIQKWVFVIGGLAIRLGVPGKRSERVLVPAIARAC